MGRQRGAFCRFYPQSGYKQVVTLLLQAGADPNAQGRYYGNALQAASEGGHHQVVTLLLDKGAA
ncbi:hypothetical protein B0J11DRAFT_437071 [Dendryphion nanum]|uniref:Uncharacterized protein n=1 Tax=Dendryphion nanum TaxID=256645 RepID=A0A9P9IK40_9PLEO|nr:hypothetical protein B0J11DRAFT_437071 [Dendryphion nanum]